MRRSLRISAVVFGSIALALGVCAQAVPSLVNYQGRLTDETGAALPDGRYTLAFRLYNTAVPITGELLIWGQQQEVSLRGGIFNVLLGAPGGTAITGAAVNDLAFAFTSASRFLELQVVRDPATLVHRTILPRQQLLSTPYAFESGRAHSLVTDLADALCPPGSIMAFGGAADAVPEGWLLCDGRALPKTDPRYARLYAAIRTGWGEPDQSSFRVPDVRGLFLRGLDDSPVTGPANRDTDRDGRGPVHPGGNTSNRVGSYEGDTILVHDHEIRRISIVALNGTGWGFDPLQSLTKGGGTSVGRTEDAGTGSETRPKNVAVNYIIKY
jgi:rhizosphere induced protein